MASLPDLVRQHGDLESDPIRHLRRLVGSWGLLADLRFADLLLFVPAALSGEHRFFIAGHVRPATSQTLYRDDQVGRFVSTVERPDVAACWETRQPAEDAGELDGVEAAMRSIPVCCNGEVIAILATDAPVRDDAERSELKRAYRSVFDSFALMVSDGTFPYESDQRSEPSVRVGDGAIVMDRAARIRFTSPNAVSALHRLGFHINAVGRSADDLGIQADVVRTAFSLLVPVICSSTRSSMLTDIMARVPST